jgi:predicted O-methyltransferase YrrM
MIKKTLKAILFFYPGPIDFFFTIIIYPAAYIFLLFRRVGGSLLPKTSFKLKQIGVYPIKDHYYEPLFNDKHLLKPLDEDRELPGLELNTEQQLNFLEELIYGEELIALNLTKEVKSELDFCIHNGSFESGDADFLYQFIRKTKPKKIIEIGSGNSTKIAQLAIKQNRLLTGCDTTHICIEPYEQPWLEELSGITLIRERIEALKFDWTSELSRGDLLFVDSSHIIRPQGDVLFEYLQIFPKLIPGVFVHIHDIFTPKDYPKNWIIERVLFFNEQYLLEALLSNTNKFEVVAALNYLKHHHYDQLSLICPYLSNESEPGSFYFRIL